MSDPVTSLIPPSLVPSGVSDDRQAALSQVFGEYLAGLDPQALVMSDPLTVDARLLPHLILEYGAEDFIDPDLPEHVQRRILSNIWNLKALHGYDAGVKLGLELLGLKAEIEHWWQVEPKRAPNTHKVYFRAEELIFDPAKQDYPRREMAAATRMVSLTKRKSQHSDIAFLEVYPRTTFARTGHRQRGKDTAAREPTPRAFPINATARATTGLRERVVDRASFLPVERSAA